MTHSVKKSFPLILFLLLISSTHYAQVNSSKADTLLALDVEEVMKLSTDKSDIDQMMNAEVVSATKQAEKLIDAPANMTVITQKDIARYGYTNLYEALARIPEIYVHYNGHNYSADFRGFFTNNLERRVLYLLNGKKLNDLFHFGDFYPDIFNDLSNVERIEVIRGPGASLYGNNSVLGVVNIITKDALEGSGSTTLSINASHLKKESAVMQYSFNHRKKYGNIGLALDVNWLNGSLMYDTQTNWSSTDAKNGTLPVSISNDVYFKTHKGTGNDAFTKGRKLPNFNFQLNSKNFSFGTFLYSRATTWVWPKDTNGFGNSANDRSWGSSGVYLNFTPSSGVLSKLRLQTSLGYYLSTNREVADFDFETSKARLRNVLFSNAWTPNSARGQEVWLKDAQGNYYEYVNRFVSKAMLTDSALLVNGGGSRFIYHGLDKVVSWDFQINPIQTDKMSLMFGGNANRADYANYQRITYRNNEFIGWARFGGIIDNGFTLGGWGQFIYKPFESLSITAGVRYDYQKVAEVYRQLGGDLRYDAIRDQSGTIIEYRPVLKENRIAQDFTPRIAVNYHFNPFTNIRLLYGQAFRMVPPQEIIRLPFDLGDAKSEKTNNFEAIFTTKLIDKIILTANAFYLKGSEIYAWNPTEASFTKATGWKNTGGSLSINYITKKFEAWGNFTYYDLQRATDAYAFMTQVVDGKTVPLPNQFKSLESPSILAKAGASYNVLNGTILATELFYNGEIQSLHPKRNNDELFYLHKVPSSFYCNLTLNQNLSVIGMRGFQLIVRAENVLNNTVWNVLPSEAENWSAAKYEKPHQLPTWGRLFSVKLLATLVNN